MKQHPVAALYADYLLASLRATTATGLSHLLEGEVSHEQGTRDLAGTKQTAAELGQTVKRVVRPVQSAQGGVSIDDSSEEKPSTASNSRSGGNRRKSDGEGGKSSAPSRRPGSFS